jgi:hypothetical protein
MDSNELFNWLNGTTRRVRAIPAYVRRVGADGAGAAFLWVKRWVRLASRQTRARCFLPFVTAVRLRHAGLHALHRWGSADKVPLTGRLARADKLVASQASSPENAGALRFSKGLSIDALAEVKASWQDRRYSVDEELLRPDFQAAAVPFSNRSTFRKVENALPGFALMCCRKQIIISGRVFDRPRQQVCGLRRDERLTGYGYR